MVSFLVTKGVDNNLVDNRDHANDLNDLSDVLYDLGNGRRGNNKLPAVETLVHLDSAILENLDDFLVALVVNFPAAFKDAINLGLEVLSQDNAEAAFPVGWVDPDSVGLEAVW